MAARNAPVIDSIKNSAAYAAVQRLPSRSRSRSSSVNRAREVHPLVPPTPSSVRANIAADLRENAVGIGIYSNTQAHIVGKDPRGYDDRGAFEEELNALLPCKPTLINSDRDWYECLNDCTLCFRSIPVGLAEEVSLEKLFTCDGCAPFGHCAIIATAVKHSQIGANMFDFNGMVCATFANQGLACMFQSYWRERPTYFTRSFFDANCRNIPGHHRTLQVGSAPVVGKRHYSRSPYCRTFTRWCADVWAFWKPCRNQSTTVRGF